MSLFRSGFEAIPGKDALFQYELKSYPVKSYVEKEGLVYKSLTATSTTFISSQWQLIGDLREVRVPNIASRNALTGSTPTSGTTGINIPILDNTNVLVINASADPQVGSNKFARYNYNKVNSTWLLLQVSTGSTSSNVSNYNLLTNRPTILSGVTITQGAGVVVTGGVMTGGIPSARGSVTIAHADTSSQANVVNTGRTYVQQLKFDTYGHVTGATSNLWTHPDTSSQANVVNTGRTYIQSISVDGDGHVTTISSSPWVHPDTSSQASSINAGSNFIQSISLDGEGHVTGLNVGTAAMGGASFNFKVNGDSGGGVTVLSGATLNITGGTNISTVRVGSGSNPGIKLNVIPAGVTNQLQYNNGGVLGASSNLVFSAGTSTLRTSNFVLGVSPSSGSTADQIITRNSSTGIFQRIAVGSIASVIAALPLNTIQYRTTNGFGGNSGYTFNSSSVAVTLGSRTGNTGTNSFTIGQNNSASNYDLTVGRFNVNSNNDSIVGGFQNRVLSGQAIVGGQQHFVSGGTGNAVFGSTNRIIGQTSFAIGAFVKVLANNSFAGGTSSISGNEVLAAGATSFIFSENDGGQTAGHGALAANSVIFGGKNHNIASGNVRAAVIGGNAIKLTGTTYIDTVAVPSLAIFTTPSAGGSDDILTWNASSKKLGKVTRASLIPSGTTTLPAGSNSQVQFNRNGIFGASSALVFLTGTSTLVTTNHTVNTSLVLAGTPTGATSDHILVREPSLGIIRKLSLSVIAAPPINAIQYRTTNGFGGNSGYTFNSGSIALTLGSRTGNTGAQSVSFGVNNSASAQGSSVLAGSSHSITSGNTHAAIIGGSGIKLTGTTYINHVAIPALAIFNTPSAGGSNDLLTWNPTTKKIGKVTQASLSGGGIGGSTGSVVNRILRTSTPTGTTLQNSLLGIDNSGNIVDQKGYKILGFTPQIPSGSSNNYVNISNAYQLFTTPTIIADGTDTDINLFLNSKGNSYVRIGNMYVPGTSSSSQQYIFNGGTTMSYDGSSSTVGTFTFTNESDVLLQAGHGVNGGDLYLTAGQGSTSKGNIALHSTTGTFGGGQNVIFIHNAAVVPTTNPTQGGILFVENGALKYRGSSGTVTTIANA
jgi:hypothetical protein